jgi:hypothetical protein
MAWGELKTEVVDDPLAERALGGIEALAEGLSIAGCGLKWSGATRLRAASTERQYVGLASVWLPLGLDIGISSPTKKVGGIGPVKGFVPVRAE